MAQGRRTGLDCSRARTGTGMETVDQTFFDVQSAVGCRRLASGGGTVLRSTRKLRLYLLAPFHNSDIFGSVHFPIYSSFGRSVLRRRSDGQSDGPLIGSTP